MVVACEPESVEDVGLGLTPAVQASVARATEVVLETLDELRGGDA
jgi:Ni,Fe-hydrogenase maturation factor